MTCPLQPSRRKVRCVIVDAVELFKMDPPDMFAALDSFWYQNRKELETLIKKKHPKLKHRDIVYEWRSKGIFGVDDGEVKWLMKMERGMTLGVDARFLIPGLCVATAYRELLELCARFEVTVRFDLTTKQSEEKPLAPPDLRPHAEYTICDGLVF